VSQINCDLPISKASSAVALKTSQIFVFVQL